jgi:hypothetical protein
MGILVGCRWLMPVILATWEAEIRRIVVRGHPEQIVCKTTSPNNQKKMDVAQAEEHLLCKHKA